MWHRLKKLHPRGHNIKIKEALTTVYDSSSNNGLTTGDGRLSGSGPDDKNGVQRQCVTTNEQKTAV